MSLIKLNLDFMLSNNYRFLYYSLLFCFVIAVESCVYDQTTIKEKHKPIIRNKDISYKLIDNKTLRLSWGPAYTKNYDEKLQYAVYQSNTGIYKIEDIDKHGVMIKGFSKEITSLEIPNIVSDKAYYFAVVVKNHKNDKAYYNFIKVFVESLKISNKTISPISLTANSVILDWNPVVGDHYQVTYSLYQSKSNNIGTLAQIDQGNGDPIVFDNKSTRFPIISLKPNTTYYFVVVATSSIGFRSIYKVVRLRTPSIVTSPSTRRVFNLTGGNVLTLHESNRVLSLKISKSLYDEFNTGYKGLYKFGEFTKMIYQKFKGDAFDFIVFCNAGSKPPTLPYHGIFSGVVNNVRGIGTSVSNTLNNRALLHHGASANLQGVLHLSTPQNIRRGPSLHELMHRWGNSVLDTKMIRGSVEVDAKPHWGYSDVGGQLGGFDRNTFKDLGSYLYEGKVGANPFGAFANGGNSLPYSKLELYLMGLIPKDQVPSIRIFSGLTGVPTAKVPNKYQFLAKNMKTITIDDIISKHGARIPNVVNSQKVFRVVVVYLTTTDLSDSQWNQFDRDVESLTRAGSDGDDSLYNFWEATGGRAILKSDDLTKFLK